MKTLCSFFVISYLIIGSSNSLSAQSRPLAGGACSGLSLSSNGILAGVYMDSDETIYLTFPIRGYRGQSYVINFDNGEDLYFQRSSGENLGVKIFGSARDAFLKSSSFKLYSSESGFIGGNFSLIGSAKSVEDMTDCVRNLLPFSEKAMRYAAEQDGRTIPNFAIAQIQNGMPQEQVEWLLYSNGFDDPDKTDGDFIQTTPSDRRKISVRMMRINGKRQAIGVRMTSPISNLNISEAKNELKNKYGEPSLEIAETGEMYWFVGASNNQIMKPNGKDGFCPLGARRRLSVAGLYDKIESENGGDRSYEIEFRPC